MPAVNYALPRWIGQPADPAAHYAQGFQIGVHLGAQQAAQMFQQQQMAMQHQKELMAEQQQEVENQYNAQVLNLKAAELARKHQANQIFQARIAQGEDPSQVLMQLAPELGESPTSVLHNQALREQARAMMQFRRSSFDEQEQDRKARIELSAKAEAGRTARSDPIGLEIQRANEAVAQGDKELAELHRARAAKYAQPTGETIQSNPDGTFTLTRGPVKATPLETAAQKSLASQQDSFDAVRAAIGSIDPSSVGPRGHIGEAWEKLMNFASPGSVKPTTTGKRQAMRVALQDIMTGFRKDAVGGRMNVQEQRMLANIGDVTGWFQSADTARKSLTTLLALQSSKSIREAKAAKEPAPSWALREITKAQAEQGFKDKWMSEEDMRNAYRLHPDWRYMDSTAQ